MRLKALALLALLAFAATVRADTITVDATGSTCQGCFGGGTLPAVNIDVQFVVQQVTGNFYVPYYATALPMTVDEVLSMTGTVNGDPMTLVAPPQGQGSWLTTDFGLGAVYFDLDGQLSWMFNDFENNLIEIGTGGGYGENIPINWTATDPSPVDSAEPATYSLLAAGLIGLFLLKRKRGMAVPHGRF